MKKWIIPLVVMMVILGCDNRSTDIDNTKCAWIHVYYIDNLIYDEKLDENDDSQSKILILPDNSQITLDKFVNIHYNIPPDEVEISRSYVVWAKKADYYTQFTSGSYLDTLQINASSGFTPIVPGEVCGTIYTTSHFPVTNLEFYILQDSVIVDSITTSVNGYFNIDLSFGDYQIIEKAGFQIYCEFIVDSYYDDYAIVLEDIALKPNIYIYPQKKMNLDVNINFQHGGEVTTSIPDYGSVWNDLEVDSSGMINDEYSYLFYESIYPDLNQYKRGWIVKREDLGIFFIQNLSETGFVGQEIIDFTDYWIPILTNYPFYVIYPQYNEQLSKMTELEFSVKPDNLLRLIYAIEGKQDGSLTLPEPAIPDFQREGFVVVEWGVIRKFGNTICLK